MNPETISGMLIDSAAKSMVVLLAGLLVVYHRRWSTASFRHSVLTASICLAVAIPLATAVIPRWRLAVLPVWDSHPKTALASPRDLPELITDDGQAVASVAGPPVSPRAIPAIKDGPMIAAGSAPHPATSHSSLEWPIIVLMVWLLGAIGVLGSYMLGIVAARRLSKSARPVLDGPLLNQMSSLCVQIGVRRQVGLRIGETVPTPMAVGVIRPMILLPAAFEEKSLQEIRSALLHELSHIRRFDLAWQLLAWIACAVYWFNPLIWIAAARMRCERELACDDAVVRFGVEPANYARLLLDVAASIQPRWTIAAPMARSSGLPNRIKMILDPAANHGRMNQGSFAIVTGLALAGLLLFAPLELATRRVKAENPPATSPIATTNAADLYMRAAKIELANDHKNIMCPAASNLEYNGFPPYEREWTKLEEADYPANAEARALAHQARSIDKVSWPDEKMPDGSPSLKYLNEVRNLANELGDAALWEHLHGDDAKAIETIRDLLHLATLVRQSHHKDTLDMISPLVTAGVQAMAMDRLNIIASTIELTTDPKEPKKAGVEVVRHLISQLQSDQMTKADIEQTAKTAAAADPKMGIKNVDRWQQTMARVADEMNISAVGLACHLYRFDHGGWPKSLEDLHDHLPIIPIDPFGDGKQTIGYIVIKGGLPDGSDRPMVFTRFESHEHLFYHEKQPDYGYYVNYDGVTHKRMNPSEGGQFRDVAGWAPADVKHLSPATRPVP